MTAASPGAPDRGSPVDVVVAGAGVVGLSAARRLAERGYEVVVLDDRAPGGAGSRAAAGVAVPSLRYAGDADVRALTVAGRDALEGDLDELGGAAWCHGEGIVRVGRTDAEQARLARLAEALPEEVGAWVPAGELVALEPALEGTRLTGGYWRAEGFVVRAEPYVEALAAAARRAGVRMQTGVGVTGVEPAAGGVQVGTGTGAWRAGALVVAAGAGSDALLPDGWELGVRPVRGQLLTVRGGDPPLRRIVSGTLYLAPWGAGEVCVGATEERAGAEVVTPAGLAVLGGFLARTAPGLQHAPVTRTWSGLRSVTGDGRPVIGALPGEPRVVVATGLGGQGILCGAAAGAAAAAIVAGESTPYAAPFVPRRARAHR